jgi:hypothetical protein
MSMKDGVPYYSEAEIKRGGQETGQRVGTDIRIPEERLVYYRNMMAR